MASNLESKIFSECVRRDGIRRKAVIDTDAEQGERDGRTTTGYKPDRRRITEALRHGRGRIDLADLKGEFSLEESTGRILQAGKEVAKRESLDRERDMIERINRL